MGGNLSSEQKEILSLIDSILSLGENMPKDDARLNVGLNPFQFLFSIIEKVASYDEIVDWLANMLVYILPSVELSLKAILIAKLKERVDCNSDPRIPYWLRKDSLDNLAEGNHVNDALNMGLLFNVHDIDYTNMLRVSPLSEVGSRLYFGTKSYYVISKGYDEFKDVKLDTYDEASEFCRKNGISIDCIEKISEIDNVYELSRAKDFNAFLWFVIHKGYFDEVNKENPFKNFNFLSNSFSGNTDGNVIMPGECYKYGNFFGLCINSKGDHAEELSSSSINNLSRYNGRELAEYPYNNKEYNYTIVPVSSDNTSANWYVNSGTYYDFLKPKSERKKREYIKEFPICNLKYLEKASGHDKNGEPYCFYDALRFTILPKPFVHVPRKGEPAWRFTRFLFDENGNPTKNGFYTVNITNKTPIPDNPDNPKYYEYVEESFSVRIMVETGEYSLEIKGNNSIENILKECYKGLTVYEFNYDYVMGMQLFDSVTVANRLISLITNLRYGGAAASLRVSTSETAYQMRISEIVKNILEAPAYEVSDCFYTFDNKKYDEMIRESELKRSQLYPFNNNGKLDAKENISGDDALKILNEFSENATLNENIDVIKRAFTKATATVTEEVLPEEKYKIKFDIISEVLKSLANVLVESLFTPKVIMLVQVNIALLGKRNKRNTIKDIDDFIDSATDIIVAEITELRDLILKEILSWVLKILKELFNVLKDEILKEQLEYYSKLIRLMLKACSFKTKHRKPLETELDNVDYADIDEIDRPKESNC